MSKDVIYFDLADDEDEENAEEFLLIIKEVFKFPFRAIISDLGKGRVFVNLVERLLPDIPHQACVLHFMRYVNAKLPKSQKSSYHFQNEFLRNYIRELLFCSCYNDAEEMLIRLEKIEHLFQLKYQKEIIRSLKRNFDLLSVHFFHEDLPRDTNIVENVIKQLDTKLKMIHGFKDYQSAYRFLKLWFCAYRFRPFSASQAPYHNGKCPLNLAGVQTQGIDWLEYSQKAKQQHLI